MLDKAAGADTLAAVERGTGMADFRVCLIGAGAGGLSMARALQRRGIAYDHFERHANVGGIWDQQNPGSPMYDSAHMISSRTQSGFIGFPMPESYPDYPSHRQILAYLRSFADAYDLKPHIAFGTEVSRAEKQGERWTVTLGDGSQHRYDALIAATGLAWHPRMPSYPGSFAGEIIHSSTYRSPEIFRGKRVLVIGAGNSGVDIASDAARTSERTLISLRRGYHFIPKHVFGKPADVFAKAGAMMPMRFQQWTFALLLRLLNGDVTRYGLKKPDHLPLSSHPIVNSSALQAMAHGDLVPKPDVERFDGNEVVFKDGSRESVDLIVAATGYIHKVPFVDPGLIASNGVESDLFLRSLSRRDPTFGAIGFVEVNGSVNPIYDEFSDVIAAYLAERKAGSAKAAEFERIARSGAYSVAGAVNYVDSPRHHVYANVAASLKAVKKLRRRLGWRAPRADEMRPPSAAKKAA
ncbi:MAG: flavin-containing monooxygenase [Rhizobiaceae bacterium]